MLTLLSVVVHYLFLYLCFIVIYQFFLNLELHKNADKGFRLPRPLVNMHLLILPLINLVRPLHIRELRKIDHLVIISLVQRRCFLLVLLINVWHELIPQEDCDEQELLKIPRS